jgi:hypothetical protein
VFLKFCRVLRVLHFKSLTKYVLVA